MLRAYWKPIVMITLLAVVVSAAAIKALPKTYTATATLLVDSNLKDPLAGRDFPAEMIASYVSTQIELLTSPIVLSPVIDRLKLTQDKEFGGGVDFNPDVLRDSVQRKLSAAVSASRGTGGQLIYVSASAAGAAKAADIANAVADVYIEQDERRLNDPANERARRYAEELAELRDKVSVAQAKVTAFSKASGISDLDTSAGLDSQTLDVLHQHLLDTQNLERSLEAKLSGQGPATDATAAAASRAQLDTELSQLAQLSSTYGPQHPKVRELNAQIALTRQSIANQSRTLTATTQSELAQAKELERKYLSAIADQESKVTKLRQAQAEGSKLLLELDSAKAVYKQALDGFDQVMFQAVANHANVSVVTRAVPPLRPSKPNKMKLMMMALAASIGLGVGAPLGYGLFVARRLRCRDDMERNFGITVLAQLGTVPALARNT